MEGLLGNPVDMDTVAYSLVYHLGVEMGLRMVEAETLPEDLSTPYLRAGEARAPANGPGRWPP